MEWKTLETYSNYAVSSTGLIRNNRTGKILKQQINSNGYHIIGIKPYGKKASTVTLKIHREVAKAFLPLIDGKDFVNHKDGVKTNNHSSNLEWVTKSENAKHAVKQGLILTAFKSGESHVQVKLSDIDVIRIREVYSPRHKEYGARALARKYNVDHSTIVKIANGSERIG